MSRKKRIAGSEVRPERQESYHWLALASWTGFFAGLLFAYAPAIKGPFLFDDLGLPFYTSTPDTPLSAWLAGVRPLLMLSYWVNYQFAGVSTFSYHLTNLAIHGLNGLLTFLLLRRVLDLASVPRNTGLLCALFGSGLFLLHPLQTESVANIAGRSESLSYFFFCSASVLFLYRRRESISWRVSGAILLLYGMAVLTKEHALTLPVFLLLTDWWWGPGSAFQRIRGNWRLYAPIASLAAAGGIRVLIQLGSSQSAGFSMLEMPWHSYFFTQCRAIWLYLRLFALPYGQNIDHDLQISHRLTDHGAWLGLAALLALVTAALLLRRRFRLASFGAIALLLLVAPTSSVVPLADPIAEHRFYLPTLGLLFVTAELLVRWRSLMRTKSLVVLSSILLLAGVLSHQRNQVWASEIALWEDTVAKSPGKVRDRITLAAMYYMAGRCDLAGQQFEIAAASGELQHDDWLSWAAIDTCQNRDQEALEKLARAREMSESAEVYVKIAFVYGRQGRNTEAREALEAAIEMDPFSDTAYLLMARTWAAAQEFDRAAEYYRRALEVNPGNRLARESLQQIMPQ